MNAIRSTDSFACANILPLPARLPVTAGQILPAPTPRRVSATQLLRRQSELAEVFCFGVLWLSGLASIVICLR